MRNTPRFLPQLTRSGAPSLFCALLAVTLVTGCSTKKSVRNQTAPVINQTNQLDDKTRADSRSINELDQRTGTGIGNAQNSANTAQQSATQANTAAGSAQQTAQDAVHRADSLSSVVSNLDTYKTIDTLSVTFAFNKADLNHGDQTLLDGLGGRLAPMRSYIVQLTGGTDSVGSASYNYDLSDRRAQAVVQYLASKYNVPPHRFYLIGLGKDQAVASNDTAIGRAKNRRVDILLLSNQDSTSAASSAPASGTSQPPANGAVPQQ